MGGWERLYKEFNEAADITLPSGEGYLNAWSILDPRLLIAAPVSFAKYPFSFLARNPISTTIVLSIIFFLSYVIDANGGGGTAFADASVEEKISSVLASLAIATLEVIVFGRLLVQVLLAERNEIIAKNIYDQCKIYSPSYNKSIKYYTNMNSSISMLGNIFPFFQFDQQGKDRDEVATISGTATYVPVQGLIQENKNLTNDGKDKVVIAILGMAHCNGIIKLLKEEIV